MATVELTKRVDRAHQGTRSGWQAGDTLGRRTARLRGAGIGYHRLQKLHCAAPPAGRADPPGDGRRRGRVRQGRGRAPQGRRLARRTARGQGPEGGAARAPPPVRSGASSILYLKARKDLRERSVENYRHAVERHLETWLDRPLGKITADMVEDRHAAIGEAAGPAAANGAMRAFRALWNFALDRDSTLPANPARRLKRAWFPMPPRERLVRAVELPSFCKAVDALPSRTHRDYLLLLLFTGLRRREAAELRWSEVDFTEGVIRLPAGRTKAGRRLNLPMATFRA